MTVNVKNIIKKSIYHLIHNIVSFSYTTPPTSISQEEWVNADLEADLRCQNWGYSKADKFERSRKVCTATNAFGCVSYEYYVNYQCVE